MTVTIYLSGFPFQSFLPGLLGLPLFVFVIYINSTKTLARVNEYGQSLSS